MRFSLPSCFLKGARVCFKGALKGQISLSLRGLVLSLELACWKGTVSAAGEEGSAGGDGAAKGHEVPLECLCFMNRGFIGAGGTYGCVQLFIPRLVPRCCMLTTG